MTILPLKNSGFHTLEFLGGFCDYLYAKEVRKSHYFLNSLLSVFDMQTLIEQKM